MRRLPPWFVMTVAAWALEGCGATARPGPAEDNPDLATLEQRAAQDRASLAIANDCKPWAWRTCRVYWTDSRGQKHCPESIEVCRPEGRGWFPCGTYQFDDQGKLRLNDLESLDPDAVQYPNTDD